MAISVREPVQFTPATSLTEWFLVSQNCPDPGMADSCDDKTWQAELCQCFD